MYTQIHWIHEFDNGAKLAIMPRPRGNDWLEAEIIKIRQHGHITLVSLLESYEVKELGLQAQPKLCAKHGIEYLNFPIPDLSIPPKHSKIDGLIDDLYARIEQGTSVIAHCRMGIGRSTLIAACILQKAKFKTDDVLERL